MAKRGRKTRGTQDESASITPSEPRRSPNNVAPATPPERRASRGRNRHDTFADGSLQRLLVCALVVIASVVAVYGRVAHFSFVSWDDDVHVYNNPYLTSVLGPDPSYFWGHAYRNLYIPATYTLWASIAPSVWPRGNPAGLPTDATAFHVTSLVLHVLNTLLALLLIRLLLRSGRFSERISPDTADWAALAGALAFAFHPMQVEAVAWISETKGLLSAFFSLLALCCYVNYITQSGIKKSEGSGGAWAWCTAASAAFLLAMLAKPSAVALPLITFAIDLWVFGRPWQQVASVPGAWLLLSVIFVLTTQSAQPVTSSETLIPPIWQRPVVAGDALTFYLYKLIAPLHLTFDYGRSPEYVLAHKWVYATFLVPLVLALLATRLPGVVKASLAVFASSLLPVLGLTPFIYQVYSTVADRYAYLAMLGPALLLAWAATRRPGGITWGVCAVIIVLWASLTYAQLGVWRNNVTLYEHGIKENPQSWVAYANLGMEQMGAGQLDASQQNFLKAIALEDRLKKPLVPHPEAYNDYGTVLSTKLNRPADAIPYFNRAIAIFPDYPEAHLNLGFALANLGHMDEAVVEVNKAISLRPNYPEAECYLGSLYGQSGQFAEALDHFKKALAVEPDNQQFQAFVQKATNDLNHQMGH